MESQEWTVKDLMEALKRFPPQAKVYYEMGPNGPGTLGKAQYVKVWGDDEMGVLLDSSVVVEPLRQRTLETPVNGGK